MTLRPYRHEDAESLAEVYRDAARNLGRKAYSAEQIHVWAMHPEDLEEFRASLARGLTVCSVVDGNPVAFGQLHPDDHIAYLYCHSAHARRGYASAILARLEAHAASTNIPVLRVEASIVSRSLFERAGYRIVEEEFPVRHGVRIARFRMEKRLPGRAPGDETERRRIAP